MQVECRCVGKYGFEVELGVSGVQTAIKATGVPAIGDWLPWGI